jgi:hypothetical protein
MKSKRPPIKICFERAGRISRQAQGSSEKFCEIHFLRLATDFLERFRKDLSDGIFGFDALSCSDQEESIQSLNVIKRGGSVQFSTCYLGIPELSRGNRVGTCRRIGVSACGVWARAWRGRCAPARPALQGWMEYFAVSGYTLTHFCAAGLCHLFHLISPSRVLLTCNAGRAGA